MKVDECGWKYPLCYIHLWCRFLITVYFSAGKIIIWSTARDQGSTSRNKSWNSQMPQINKCQLLESPIPTITLSQKYGWRYLGNEKSYERSAGVKTTVFWCHFIFCWKNAQKMQTKTCIFPSCWRDQLVSKRPKFRCCFRISEKSAEMHVFLWKLKHEKSPERSSYFEFLTGGQNPIIYNKANVTINCGAK